MELEREGTDAGRPCLSYTPTDLKAHVESQSAKGSGKNNFRKIHLGAILLKSPHGLGPTCSVPQGTYSARAPYHTIPYHTIPSPKATSARSATIETLKDIPYSSGPTPLRVFHCLEHIYAIPSLYLQALCPVEAL